MSFVLDSSLTIAWFVSDEHRSSNQSLLDRAADQGAVVPILWRMETANALLLATRRKRITIPQRAEALRLLGSLPLEVDSETASHAWGSALRLADSFRLTLYDACYLELAQRRGLPLASLDSDLRAAARKLKIPLL
jgi:predicted nucleic acid-binding protein